MAQENKNKLIQRMPVIDFVIGPYHIHDLKDIISRHDAVGSHVVMAELNSQRVQDYSELRAVRKSKILLGFLSCKDAINIVPIVLCLMCGEKKRVERFPMFMVK